MSYTAQVTKQSVKKVEGKDDYNITISVVIKEDSETIMEKNYSERYNSTTAIGDVKNALQAQIQADWDVFIAEQGIFDAVAFDTMVSTIQSNLNTYINS